MKHIKLFEAFGEGSKMVGSESPYDKLYGDNKIVFDIVDGLCESLFEFEFFERYSTKNRFDPIITCIIDQNKGGGPHDFPEDKQFYIFVNNVDGVGYVEVESGIDDYNFSARNAEPSSHGYPASYGKDIYTYDRKTGEVTYDENFFKHLISKERNKRNR